MAVVLDVLAHYLKMLIQDMARGEVSMLLGVSREITKLEDHMESLKTFLADAERRHLTEQSVRRWLRKLEDAMYDATDIIDLCQLKAEKRRGIIGGSPEEKVPGCFQPLLFCLWNPVFAHGIGSRIKALNQRLEGIHKEADNFKFSICLGCSPEPRKLAAAARFSQKMTSEFDESAIVGEKIERETRELAQLLITNSDHDIKVVSIVGTGGMGKTTLAQKILGDTIVRGHFKLKIWLSITQHFDEAELLRTAIKHSGGYHDGEQDKTLLTRTLSKTLSTGRFLLVLDDVWSDKAWSDVLGVPVKRASQKQPGNWVLITTRLGDLAQRMGTSFYQHHVSPLNEEDAWSLLIKQLPRPANQEARTNHLKDVGMKIVKKCGGLPLAVKVMGGLLSTRSQIESEWEAVLNHRAWSVAGLPKDLDNRIYLSYDDLPPQIKQCFLYCSLFPKGTSIWQSIIVPMWISEGFIQPRDRSSLFDDALEEIANEYYHELITRNLIEPTEGSSINKYQCTMHDVVRSFAEFMAKEDLLVVQDRQFARSSHNKRLIRRMSIGPSTLVPEWAVLRKEESLRTLIINCKINFELNDSLIGFSRLRVLFIEGGDCDRLVGSLCHFRYLRYICLKETNISRLPKNIHMMKFLQHIILRDDKNFKNLPITIIRLEQLRTLSLKNSNVKAVIPKGFGRLTNLRSLYGFPVQIDMDGNRSWCSLEELGPLSQLRDLTLNGLENVSTGSFAEMAKISSKEHLDYLELHCSSNGFMASSEEMKKKQRAMEEVFEKLCPPSSIQDLQIKGYFGCQLPNWMNTPSAWVFKSLRLLTLEHLFCCTELPHGLSRLPSLDSLTVKDAPSIKCVGPEFLSPSSLAVFGGIVTATSVAAFTNLTSLYLEGLCEWKEWEWEEQGEDETTNDMAMPSLKSLTIKNCKLSSLPTGIASSKRRALRGLYLYELTNLTSVENFHSVVELDVFDCPMLQMINDLSRLQKLRIFRCRKVEVLERVPSLDSLEMKDTAMETLPDYLKAVNPRYLKLTCNKKLYESVLTDSSSEYNKIAHVRSRAIDYSE